MFEPEVSRVAASHPIMAFVLAVTASTLANGALPGGGRKFIVAPDAP